MTAHIAPSSILSLLHQLGTVISMLQPTTGIPDPVASLALRKIIHVVFTGLLLMLDRRGIDYDSHRAQFYNQLEFLMWSIHSLYGTTATQSFLELPTQ